MLLNFSVICTAQGKRKSLKIGEKEELCSDIGHLNIGSAKECSRVAKILKLSYRGIIPQWRYDEEEPHMNRSPTACFLVEPSLVFWNPDKVGARNDLAKPICQNAGKIIMVYCIFLHIFLGNDVTRFSHCINI